MIDYILNQQGNLRQYVNKELIGEEIKNSLLKKFKNFSIPSDATRAGFAIGYRDENTGFMTDTIAGTSLLLLLNVYKVKFNKEEKEVILKLLDSALLHINKNGFDLDPFVDVSRSKGIIGKDSDFSYIDSMTWAFSFFVYVRYSCRMKLLEISENTMNSIKNSIESMLHFFINNVIYKGEVPIGWGYTNGCQEPSIYFTYAVLEAFNDFDDYIVGQIELNIDEDTEFLHVLNERYTQNNPLHVQFQRIKYSVGNYFWDQYKELLGNHFFNDNNTIITKEQIINSTKSSAIFNTLHVLLILLYSETDKYIGSQELIRSQLEKEKMLLTMRQSVQQVLSFYQALKNEGLEYIIDKHILSFEQKHPKKTSLSKVFNIKDIQTSTLIPILIKVNSLITFYIVQFPDKEMGRYLDLAIENRVDNATWLWDNTNYNLLTTERYIEAIIDFYDYYETFEIPYLKNIIETKQIEQAIRDQLSVSMRQEIEKNVQLERTRELDKQKEAIFDEFKVQNEMKALIIKTLSEEFGKVFVKYLSDASLVNKSKPIDLNDPHYPFLVVFEKFIRSYFYQHVEESSFMNKLDEKDFENDMEILIEEYLKEDVINFIRNYLISIADGKADSALQLSYYILDKKNIPRQR